MAPRGLWGAGEKTRPGTFRVRSGGGVLGSSVPSPGLTFPVCKEGPLAQPSRADVRG